MLGGFVQPTDREVAEATYGDEPAWYVYDPKLVVDHDWRSWSRAKIAGPYAARDLAVAAWQEAMRERERGR